MKCDICGKKIHKHEPHNEVGYKHKVRTKLGERVVTDYVKVCYRCNVRNAKSILNRTPKEKVKELE